MFIFVMVATFSFLLTRNMDKTSAVDYTDFKAGNIMSDAVMRNYTSMTEAEIQNFLNNRNKCNRAYDSSKKASYKLAGEPVDYYSEKSPYTWHVTNTKKGTFVCINNEKINGETAAHIIYQAAQDYKINPQVLIVLLEKEQGLITDTFPHSIQYRSATGYGCPDNAKCNEKYYGLKNQVRNAAALFNTVLSGGWTNYPLGWNTIRWSPKSSCGSSKVYIENLATSALYRYTPYQPNAAALKAGFGQGDSCSAYGNRNFYGYFTQWFGSTQKVTPRTASITFSENDTFTFKTADGKYIVPKTAKSESTLIASATADEASRTYKFVKSGEFYVIKHVKTGLVIDIDSADINEGKIQLYASNDTSAQKWRISETSSGYLIHSAILDNLVLDYDKDGVSLEFFEEASKTQSIVFTDTSEAVIKDDTYLFETTGGKAMDLYGAKTAENTAVNIYDISYKDKQIYNVARREDGFYSLVNVAANKSLSVASSSTKNGAAIQINTTKDSCAQKWIIEKVGDNYRLLSACSGKAVDIPNAAVSKNDVKLQLNETNETNSQIWILRDSEAIEAYKKAEAEAKAKAEAEAKAKEEAEIKAGKTVANGTYTIVSSINKKYVLDVKGAGTAIRTNVQIYTSNGTKAQKFKLTYDTSKKAYRIVNVNSNKSIDAKGAGTSNKTNIQIYTKNNSCAQFWKIKKNSNNTYTFTSTCSSKVLDVNGGTAKNSTNVQLYTSNGTKAQQWTLKAV
jgi:hypothetical protein